MPPLDGQKLACSHERSLIFTRRPEKFTAEPA